MITTTLQQLINASILSLREEDPGYFSSYAVDNSTVLLDEDSKRIVLIQVVHDENDKIVICLEDESEQVIAKDEPLQVRLFDEIRIDGSRL